MNGFIFMWSGGSLPDHAYLCDGSGGRPDLRNRFIKGASASSAAHATGGSSNRDHTHTIATCDSLSHFHVFSSISYIGGYHHHNSIITMTSGGPYTTDLENAPYPVTFKSVLGASILSPANHHTMEASTIPSHGHTMGYAFTGEDEGVMLPRYYRIYYIIIDTPYFFPIGSIVMWAGDPESLLSGWVLCDGSNGTPDLRDKMIRGASTDIDILSTGGSVSHTHSLSDGAHKHGTGNTSSASIPLHSHEVSDTPGPLYDGNTDVDQQAPSTSFSHSHGYSSSGGHAHAVSSPDAFLAYPPYYNLAFIMRV